MSPVNLGLILNNDNRCTWYGSLAAQQELKSFVHCFINQEIKASTSAIDVAGIFAIVKAAEIIPFSQKLAPILFC